MKNGITKTPIASLRHRLTIEQLSDVSDGQGGYTVAWSALATVWGKLEPVSSRERYFAKQVQYQRSHKAIIRFRDDVTNTMRITFDNRTFQIKGVYSPDERKAYLFLDLEENQGT